jgi:tetratricopeptide (TPR) repeat protein
VWNRVKTISGDIATICFVLISVFSFIVPVAAQPNMLRLYDADQRKAMTLETQERVDKLTRQIQNDKRNVALYKKRLEFYHNLLELNFDNSSWEIYANKFEADLSRIIRLEGTAENYSWRANLRQTRLLYSYPFHFSPPKNLSELYPHNRFVDGATADYMEVLKRTSVPLEIESVYTNLRYLYSMRPQILVMSPNFPKWRSKIRLKLVFDDFDKSIKYGLKAVEIDDKISDSDTVRALLAGTYKLNGDAAVKLGTYQIALELYEAGKKYLSNKYSQCAYYAAWGNAYVKLNKFDKAIEIFNTETDTNSDICGELFGNRGDAFVAKGDFQMALSDYNKALTYDKSDSLKRYGWLYFKRAKLFLQVGKTEEALADLNTAIKKKYIAECPQVYQLRAKVYRKLGKSKLAVEDIQTANKLKNQMSCLFSVRG